MKKLLPILFLFFAVAAIAQRGKDGDRTITAASTIVNEYTVLTADAVAGQSQITVANNGLNANNRFSAALAAGDLVMIIQMQGASINTADAASYGTITSYNNSGKYEFAEVLSVNGANTINFACALQNSYTAAGHVQVVRVPRYNTLTINANADITCPGWDASTGGIIATETLGNTTIAANGKITATGRGFRGGRSNENESTYGVTGYTSTFASYGGEKGEGIAGTWTDYDNMNGRYSRGAPANAGGGGNGHNGGGGGGGNAGDTSQWTGHGVPDLSNSNWAQAWNLQFAGFSTAVSHGGGQGGYTFSSNDQNALTTPLYTSVWGGDWRNPVGGVGGRPLDYTTGRIFMGGGGGAGDQNDNTAGDGGNGGGIVYLISYGTVTGGGLIESNGSNGQSSGGGFAEGNDGGGGGGAGGTIFVNANTTLTNLTIKANGGNGGDQLQLFGTDAYGPGGGGGAGYIATNAAPNITREVLGGANGETNSPSFIEFPSNGATKGFQGVTVENLQLFDLTATGGTACSGQQITLTATLSGTPPQGYEVEWYSVDNGFTVLGTGTNLAYTFNGPATVYVHVCPGNFSVPVSIVGGTPATAGFTYTDNGQYNVTFSNTSANADSYLWNFGNGNTSTLENPEFTFQSDGTFPVTLIATNDCGSDTITVNVTVIKEVGLNTAQATQVKLVYGNQPGEFYLLPGTDACGQINISITDLSGRIIEQNRLYYQGNGMVGPINLANAAPGMYLLSFVCQNKVYYAKLVTR